GSFLFITNDKVSYQIKGPLSYHTEGPIFDDMKRWLDPKQAGLGAVVLHVEEVYCGGEDLLRIS
ncbi:MAG: pyridoxamine 5'-phosphate oxidase family protein, partial [Deltaproteobacteria bacterium]|nr:pyridoxamine 5'-phosphate oxidase family protein [Deltaproteobacteria bacterium]